MLKIAWLAVAVTLAGCASTRQERAAAFQHELPPQLVAACNRWANPQLDASTRRDGFEACDRLSVRQSLTLTDLATVSAYHRAKSGALRSPPTWGVVSVPAPLPQSQ